MSIRRAIVSALVLATCLAGLAATAGVVVEQEQREPSTSAVLGRTVFYLDAGRLRIETQTPEGDNLLVIFRSDKPVAWTIDLAEGTYFELTPAKIAKMREQMDRMQREMAEALKQMPPEQRRAAKAINFGLMYGMSPFGLAKQLGIDRSEAKQYVDRYFARYPSVRDFMERIRATAREQGYVETVFRRRLYLPEIHSRNAARRQYAERTAINAPMQGTAADIIKRAMIAIDAQLLQRHVEIKLIMQVHDELVFEVPAKLVDSATVAIRRHMEGAAELSVPLKVDIGIGDNWDEAH